MRLNTAQSNHGWLSRDGVFIRCTGRGHMATVIHDPESFGFASQDDVVATSEYARLKDLTGTPVDLLCSLLDGDEGLWQALYDRGWVRIIHGCSGRYGIVVEDEATARVITRHLADAVAVLVIDVDLYNRRTERVYRSFRLDEEAIDAYLRFGHLRQDWCVFEREQVDAQSPENDRG